MSGRDKNRGQDGIYRRGRTPVTAPESTASSGGATLPINLGTDVTGDLPFANLAQIAGLSVLGVAGNATADVASIAAGTDHQVLRRSGTALAFGALALDQAAAVTGKLPWANLADVSATSRILARKSASSGVIEEATLSEVLDFIGSATRGDVLYRGNSAWARLPAGTSGQFLQTLGASSDPVWATAAIGGGALYSGTGHPQGVQAGALGSLYVDANNGYLYRKCGGGSTAYGWYFVPLLGSAAAVYGPQMWESLLPSSGTTNIWGGSSHGAFSTDNTVALTGNSLNSAARTILSGKSWAQAQTGGVSGNTSGVNTVTTNMTLLLDDDVDITALVRFTDVTSVRIWFGLSIAAFSVDTATHGSTGAGSLCFRYSTAESDPGWVGIGQTNGAGNQTVSAQVAAIAANTNYLLRIRFVRSGTPTAYFSVNDGTEVAVTGNIPPTGGSYMIGFSVTTKTGAARVFLCRGFGATIGS